MQKIKMPLLRTFAAIIIVIMTLGFTAEQGKTYKELFCAASGCMGGNLMCTEIPAGSLLDLGGTVIQAPENYYCYFTLNY